MDGLHGQGASRGRDELHSVLSYKRLSRGKYKFWPCRTDQPVTPLQAHELVVLLQGGDPGGTRAAPAWRPVTAVG